MPTSGQQTAANSGMRRDMRGVVLLVHALRLSWKAQRIRSSSLSLVVERLLATRFLPRAPGTEEASQAAGRACRLLSRFAGGVNTCLTRSLVTGTMLAERGGIVLHVGFRMGQGSGMAHEGHAWITVQGEHVSDPLNTDPHNRAFVESLRLPLRRA